MYFASKDPLDAARVSQAELWIFLSFVLLVFTLSLAV